MKYIFIFLFISLSLFAREKGQTEITTDQGIEVFQKEKYYLLKENVEIISDNFKLNADLVRAYFDKDLYDIVRIESEGNVTFITPSGANGKSEILNYSIIDKKIHLLGPKSSLILNEIEMYSDELIIINDIDGKFKIEGKSSRLKSKDVDIMGSKIDGLYEKINEANEIINIIVIDDKISTIITNQTKMYAKKAIYNKEINIIELFNNVKIIRNNEVVTGDYGKINTLDESYKIMSNDSNKVKVYLNKTEE